MWAARDVANMGLPPPGAEVKLVPMGVKFEARVKGPNITPGYWRQPELTRAAFDEEGYYRLGDSFVFADPQRPAKGLLFAAASPRTSSSPPAPGCTSARCARGSSSTSRRWCATW